MMLGQKFFCFVDFDRGEFGHEVVTDARLRERHLGIFQGLNGDEITAKYPEERRQFRTRGPDYVIPGGESMATKMPRANLNGVKDLQFLSARCNPLVDPNRSR